MNNKINELYKKVILHHNKEPYNFIIREDATIVVKANNALCGDRFDIFFDIENGKLSNISFHGFGCVISKASTSVLVKKLNNQPIKDTKKIIDLFIKNFSTDNNLIVDDEEMAAFAPAKLFTGRMKCAILAWEEVKNVLNNVKIEK